MCKSALQNAQHRLGGDDNSFFSVLPWPQFPSAEQYLSSIWSKIDKIEAPYLAEVQPCFADDLCGWLVGSLIKVGF